MFPVNPIIRKILEQLFLLLSGLGPTSLCGYCNLVGSWWGDFSLLVFWGLLFLFFLLIRFVDLLDYLLLRKFLGISLWSSCWITCFSTRAWC